jgi:hypothetical protein
MVQPDAVVARFHSRTNFSIRVPKCRGRTALETQGRYRSVWITADSAHAHKPGARGCRAGNAHGATFSGFAGSPTPTATAAPTTTPTNSPTNTPTATATQTPTPTGTATPTITPSNTPTNTPTATPTQTPTPTWTATPTPSVTSTPVVCIGDCNGDGHVTIDRLLTLVNIALGSTQPAACRSGVPNRAEVDVALILQAVNNALSVCGGGHSFGHSFGVTQGTLRRCRDDRKSARRSAIRSTPTAFGIYPCEW